MAPAIEQEIWIDAPVDVVWRTVTEPQQVSRWFADEADLTAKPGQDGTLTFTDKATHQRVSAHITVQAVEPDRMFSYRWLHEAGTEPAEGNSVLVEFTLTPENGGTRLRVAETGLERMGWPREQQDTYARDHIEGWVTHLTRLRDLLGRRHVDQAR
jgi:uncharacterized protein YndB with AHSA1/START domain